MVTAIFERGVDSNMSLLERKVLGDAVRRASRPLASLKSSLPLNPRAFGRPRIIDAKRACNSDAVQPSVHSTINVANQGRGPG